MNFLSARKSFGLQDGDIEDHPDKLQLASWSGDEAAVESMLNEESGTK